MKKILLSALIFIGLGSFSQTTWSEDVAEIFYNNCVTCHRPDGIGPFSLLDYSTADVYKVLIKAEVETGSMPPWKADTLFQHYFDERILSDYERTTIINWVNEGGLEGDPGLAPPPPVFSGEQILPGTPDLSLSIPKYMSKATALQDDYVCISVPSGLTEERRVKAIEIIPGNHATVHHCLIYADAAATYATDTIGGDCGGPSDLPLMAGYTPGARPTIFPGNDDFSAGMLLQPGTNIVFAMHYPHGSYGTWDSTKVNFYFYDEPVADFREVYAFPLNNKWGFTIPANEIDTLYHDVIDLPFDLTFLSVFPHMHLLGDYMESYGVTPSNDTVNLVRIPKWDFEWQDFYWFEYLQHLPSSSNIYSTAVYNNTPSNLHNPYDPPEDINAGFNTTDEMYLIYYHFMGYEPGDEFVNQDSLNTIYLSNEIAKYETVTDVKVFPNPSSQNLTIEFDAGNNSLVSLYIYDMNGRIVNKLVDRQNLYGFQSVSWDGNHMNNQPIKPGVYVYSITINGKHYSGRIIRQ